MPKKEDIKYIIVHHTATDRDTTKFTSLKDSYNWVITADGILHESRPQNLVGGHCRADRMNYRSLGICLTGDFRTQQATSYQIKTLTGIIKQLMDLYNIPIENILGHSEVKGSKTVCPGKILLSIIKGMRDDKDNLNKIKEELRIANEKLDKIKEILS